VLPQAVTTVWRTELGTTLLNGFDSTTDTSAYFHYLAHLSLPRPPYEAEFLSRMASRHAGASLLSNWFYSGATRRDRTGDLLITNQAEQVFGTPIVM